MSETKVVDKSTIYSLFGRHTKNAEKRWSKKEINKKNKYKQDRVFSFIFSPILSLYFRTDSKEQREWIRQFLFLDFGKVNADWNRLHFEDYFWNTFFLYDFEWY